MSNSELTPQVGSSAANKPRLIQQRFALRHLMAETALADIYQAHDLHGTSHSTPEAIMLLLLVKPALSSMPGFHKTWQQLLARSAPPTEAYPTISAYGEDQGVYWLAYTNTTGSLLSETLQALDERGMPLEQALDTVEAIILASSSVQAGAFGYLEAGTTQHTAQGYVILNAPLVKILHQLLSQNAGNRQPLALHSAYISPSAAVGETPLTEDDTFSVACLLYHLLNANAPYGQSTLTAAARGDIPASTRKLNKHSKETLRNALALQRSQRPENPDQLIQAIRKQHKRKLLFPLALLAAAGIATYASYHLLSKVSVLFETMAPAPHTQEGSSPTLPENASTAQTIVTPEPAVATQVSPLDSTVELVNEPDTEAVDTPVETTEVPIAEPDTADAPPEETTETTEAPETTATEDTDRTAVPTVEAATEVAAETIDRTDTTTAQEIQRLTEQASVNLATDMNAALNLLREAWALDKQDASTKDLLNQLLKRRQQQAENQIQSNKPDEAKQTLAENDQLIREFILTDRIQDQVRLENLVEIRAREQEQAETLLGQARLALQRGHLSSEDGNDDNALSHLNKLMFMLPSNREGQRLIAQVVSTRQQDIQQALERGELEQAGTYLAETERLIRKYNLNDLKKTQAKLDADYMQATMAPSITPSSVLSTEAVSVTPEQIMSEQPGASVLLPPADGSPVPTEDVEILEMPVEASTEAVLVPAPEVVSAPAIAVPQQQIEQTILAPISPDGVLQSTDPAPATISQTPQTVELIDLPPVPFDDEPPAAANSRIPLVPALTPSAQTPQTVELIDLPPVPFDDELPALAAPMPFDASTAPESAQAKPATAETTATPLQEELFEIPVSVINDGLQENDRK